MSTPTLKELINELNSVLRWHTLGVNLGLKTQQLGTIERNYRGDDERCRTEMLACWIDNTTHPTWKSVAEALYLMKEYSVADKIQRKYIISTTTKEAPSTIKLSKVAIFAYENEQKIKARFAGFQTNVCSKLLRKGVDTEEFRLFVTSVFSPGDCIPPRPASLTQIFEAITRHGLWDYLHYSPLVRIAQQFCGGDSEIEAWIQTYKKDLRAYSLLTTVEDYLETDLNVSDHLSSERAKYDPRYCRPMEWKTEFIDHSLQYLTDVWKMFSDRYLVPDCPPTAILDRVRKGCFSVTWLIPSHLIQSLIERIKIDTNFFPRHNILRVSVEEKCAYEEAFDKFPLESERTQQETLLSKAPLVSTGATKAHDTLNMADQKEKFGGYDCKFVDPPPSAFQTECPICHLLLCNPYQTTCCGTSFCHSCIKQIQTGNHLCPTCRKDNFKVSQNKGLKRSLSQLYVLCTHSEDGCEWRGELGEIEHHLKVIHFDQQQLQRMDVDIPRVGLELKPVVDLSSKIFKVKIGCVLRFTLSPSLYGRKVHLYTNCPAPNTHQCRSKMRELHWISTTRKAHWDPDCYVDIYLDCAGSYRFKYIIGASAENEVEYGGFFVVEPTLTLNYDPNSLCCQTYLTKLLGQLPEWKSKLRVAKQTNYNMLHFTPIQQLSSSQGAFSISNQMKVDSSYLPANYIYNDVTVIYTTREGVMKELHMESSFEGVKKLVEEIHNEWGLLSIMDVVWNRTSFDTPWLIEHPEAGYNLVNSPHLRPAYALDVALAQFSRELAEGEWEKEGLYPKLQFKQDVDRICSVLLETVLPRACLWEYYCVDVEAVVKEFYEAVCNLGGGSHPRPVGKKLQVLQDPKYRRMGSRVNINLTLELFNLDWPGVANFEERIECCCSALRKELHQLNQEIEKRVQNQLELAAKNLTAYIHYKFLDQNGPHRQMVTVDEPLFPRYFVTVGDCDDLLWQEVEEQQGEYIFAVDGWIKPDADTLVNFAAEGSNAHFQRELTLWENSVKLRYGRDPDDSPWLWEYMCRYTEISAWIFDGFHINDCHNTPIHVAEWMLDAARDVKPNLYIVAESTSTEDHSNYFVNRLGINSLIRKATSPHVACDLLKKYGGEPVGCFLPTPCGTMLKPSVAHSMFIDATLNSAGHIQFHNVHDALPNTAFMAIASCASGGYRGNDELLPHVIDVVKETRYYTHWASFPSSETEVGTSTGIMAAKAELNALHRDLAEQGFTQIYVDQMTEEIVAVTRHSPSTHESVILISHTAFRVSEIWANSTAKTTPHCRDVPGVVQEVILEARLVQCTHDAPPFQKHPFVINGLQSHVLDMQTRIPISQSKMCLLAPGDSWGTQKVIFNDFCPGSIIAFRVSLMPHPEACSVVRVIRSFLGKEESSTEGKKLRQAVEEACSLLSLLDLNYALYRCDSEEKDEMKREAYIVPRAGALVYCGLQGIVGILKTAKENNNLSHPICLNLNDGNWIMDYTTDRLKLRVGTEELGNVLYAVFEELKVLPRYLIPCYFEAVISLVHSLLTSAAVALMGSFVRGGSSFVKGLALGSVELLGECSSGRLPPPVPMEQPKASLAAGLPHFATGFMRCWGRDTFISLRGLLLITGRHKEARDTLLSFATCLRHGLIPNLLDGGANPRYNCRDAAWWWLQSVQDYCQFVPNGHEILEANVRKLYPVEDSPADFEDHEVSPLSEIVQEILQSHISGISFRERGAGPSLDHNMNSPGFDVQAGVDLETGFVYGGNIHNCGTWMNKVGESSKAGNKGVPATPRDGSAVELVGLCHSAVSWLAKLYKQGVFPYPGVEISSDEQVPKLLTFRKWANRISEHFEARFWVPKDRTEASLREGIEAGHIHRTGIYKDCVGTSQRYADFQLRPNFPVAMVVSPELFTKENAWEALSQVEDLLLGPLGMCTLDPADDVYSGYYSVTVDSDEHKTALGFNYHQGPEWLWVLGYFLRAKLHFAQKLGTEVDKTISRIHEILSAHAQALQDSPWAGLPELTNKDGSKCTDNCPVQAWSMACLLDVMYDLHKLQSNPVS